MKKIISALIILTIIFSIGSPMSVNAAEPQLTIITQYGEPVEGIYIKIYLVASRNSDGTYSHEAPFADKIAGKNLVEIVSSAEDNAGLTKELLKVVSSAEHKGYKSTDTQGKAAFPIPAEGLYLVMQDTTATGSANNSKYIMQSFILPVPYLISGGELEYDVTAKFDEKNLAQLAKPKLELITTEREATTTTTTTDGGSGSSGNNNATTTTSGENEENNNTTTTAAGGGNGSNDDDEDENPSTNILTNPSENPSDNPSDNPSNPPPSEIPSQPVTQAPAQQTPTEPTIELPTEMSTEAEELPEEEISNDRIPLANGWFAEYNEDEDLWYIYDENGVPLGVIFLPDGENIENFDVEGNIIPFAVQPFPEEPETIVIIKSNPITGDSILDLIGLIVVAGLCAYYVVSRKKKEKE